VLLEEPVGLVSASGIRDNSSVNQMLDRVIKERGFEGKVTDAIKRNDPVLGDRYRFNERQIELFATVA
jgi:hypothetical protein